MDILSANFLNTTTQLTIDSGTFTAELLFNRDTFRQHLSQGFNNDLTTSSIVVNFDSTQTVSRIAMLQTNVKALDIFYDGLTANTFSLTTTSSTSVSSFVSNSETSMYFRFSAVNCTSVTFDLKSTQSADAEKAIGWLMLSNPLVNFEVDGRIPSAKNYKPSENPKQVVHKMSDGGIRLQTVALKRSAEIKFKYIEKSFRDKLKTVFNAKDSFIFDAFGTTTGWTDEFIFEAVWPGKFDLFRFSDNAVSSGYTGKIKIQEVSY